MLLLLVLAVVSMPGLSTQVRKKDAVVLATARATPTLLVAPLGRYPAMAMRYAAPSGELSLLRDGAGGLRLAGSVEGLRATSSFRIVLHDGHSCFSANLDDATVTAAASADVGPPSPAGRSDSFTTDMNGAAKVDVEFHADDAGSAGRSFAGRVLVLHINSSVEGRFGVMGDKDRVACGVLQAPPGADAGGAFDPLHESDCVDSPPEVWSKLHLKGLSDCVDAYCSGICEEYPHHAGLYCPISCGVGCGAGTGAGVGPDGAQIRCEGNPKSWDFTGDVPCNELLWGCFKEATCCDARLQPACFSKDFGCLPHYECCRDRVPNFEPRAYPPAPPDALKYSDGDGHQGSHDITKEQVERVRQEAQSRGLL